VSNKNNDMPDPIKICGSSAIKTIQGEKARTALFAGLFLAVGVTSAVISGRIAEGEESRGLTTTMIALAGAIGGISLGSLAAGNVKNKKDVVAMFVFAASLLVCLAISFGRQHNQENETSDTKRAPVIASSVISLLAFVGISGLGVYSSAFCK
tara:strand:+ start:2073 stop:2531 length:459 start_codon:yes stop_codon:yes gene_type:complete